MAAPQYASVAQLIQHIDQRLLAQMTSDSGADAVVDGANTVLVGALERASSDVESYAMRGERYTVTDLELFEAAGDTTLIGLVCDLVVSELYARRGSDVPDAIRLRHDRAKATLKDLGEGKLVFGKSPAAQAAGVAQVKVIDAPTRLNMDMASDSRLFPVRRTRVF